MEEHSQQDILHHQADPPVPGIGYMVLCCFCELFVLFFLFFSLSFCLIGFLFLFNFHFLEFFTPDICLY